MLKHIVCLIILLMPAISEAKQQGYVICGRVLESFTGENLTSVTFTLMTADSTVIRVDTPEGRMEEELIKEVPELAGYYQFEVTDIGTYIVRASRDGYETGFTNVKIVSRRQTVVLVKPIRLMKQMQELPEVVVKPTTLKMIYSGDTIIYNASAFKTPEGSMLDDLIRLLPGANINDNGVITVNGRYVESLLVDGREFFKGNPKVALQNLPAYTVSKVKVYRKRGPKSTLLNRDMKDSPLVMDVNLKREYSTGYLGNLETGGGTAKRYSLSALGMRFSKIGRLITYGNMNNQNDNRSVSSNGSWTPNQLPTGRRQIKKVGAEISRFFDKESEFVSNNTYTHSDNQQFTKSFSQTILNGGDLYSQGQNSADDCFGQWSSGNFLILERDGIYSTSSLKMDYSRQKSNSLARFSTSDAYKQLNSLEQQGNGHSSAFTLDTETENTFRVAIVDLLRFTGKFHYDRKCSEHFSLYDLKYTEAQTPRDYRNMYTTAPSQHTNATTKLEYDYIVRGHTIRPYIHYSYDYGKTTNLLYRLDRLTAHDSTRFDRLPSETADLTSVIDTPNSYIYRLHTHQTTCGISYALDFRKGKGYLHLNIPFMRKEQTLNASRNGEHRLNRHFTFCSPELFIRWMKSGLFTSLTLNYTTETPDLTAMLDYRDDSDPLYIRLGNPSLKSTHQLKMTAELELKSSDMARALTVKTNLATTDHAVAYGRTLDNQTGVITSRPENVSGNWYATLEARFNGPLDKRQRLTIDCKLSPTYNRSVDLAWVTGTEGDRKSIVNNWHLEETTKLNWNVCRKLSWGIHGRVNWSCLTSPNPEFTTIKATDFNIGTSVVADLPWKIQLTTELTDYFHRGYHNAEMNKSELVWNVKLSRTLLRKRLTLSLSAFDTLNQIDNHTYILNSQGRTETWNNTLPRYGMLTASWRFNRNPKKK